MKKRTWIILCIVVFLIILSVFALWMLIKPKAHFDISIKPCENNNTYHNTLANGTSSLVQIDDKLYYNYRNGDGLRYGTYEITESMTRRVYWEGPALSPRNISLDNVYDGQIAEDIETYLDILTGEKIHVDSVIPQELSPNHSFVVNDVWYFYTLDNNQELYRMNGEKPELLVSADTLGEPEMPFEMYIDDSFIYYVSYHDGLCKFSLDSGSRQSILPDELTHIENALSTIRCLFAKDGRVYYLVDSTDIYETDFNRETTTLLYHSDDNISSINMLDDTLFFSDDAISGSIFSLSVTNRTKESLPTKCGKVNEIYLLDKDYVYYNDYHENLFRINRKTKEIEIVFD